MDPITQQTILAAAGAGGDPVYVDDVFSTFIYDGNGGTQTISNGIDISGEGGLVWVKQRNESRSHNLCDTERGATKILNSSNTSAEATYSTTITGFTGTGFSVGSDSGVNHSSGEYASWTFRKAPGFFDVVEFTQEAGTPTNQRIPHSLGTAPGMIWMKCTSASRDWFTYHRSLGKDKYMKLNSTVGSANSPNGWGTSEPDNTEFGFNAYEFGLSTGSTYVAYIFAHDDAQFGTDEDQSIIKCGITPTVSQYSTETIDLGFEPQFLLMKAVNQIGSWMIVDMMRGVDTNRVVPPSIINPSSNSGEGTSGDAAAIFSNGYIQYNGTGGNTKFIYMAIRRPNKPPELATEVFAIDNQGTGTMPPQYHSNFVVDMALEVSFGEPSQYRNRKLYSRIQLNSYLKANLNNNSFNTNREMFTWMDGFGNNNSSVSTSYAWMFKRAPGFMDVLTYVGDFTTGRQVIHNLGVVPELIIVKRTDANGNWGVYHKDLPLDGGSQTQTQAVFLNFSTGPGGYGFLAGHDYQTATHFTTWISSEGDWNKSNARYIAYLFATLPGISKVGSYSGTGNAINVDCGFTNGARFILIKRSGTGDWYLWDSLRGIASGNDPYFIVNGTAGQVTGTDYIDPLSAGFTVTSSAPAALNTSGGTYIFLAIA